MALGEIQSIHISLENHRFQGRGFEPEVIYNFIELEIDEIYDLGYTKGTFDDIVEDYNFETNPDLRQDCLRHKNVYDILALTEHSDESGWRLETVSLRFTNGLYISYGIDANFVFQIDNERLFYEYLNAILKQYGYLPEKIYGLVRQYHNKTVYINRPGIFYAIDEVQGQMIQR